MIIHELAVTEAVLKIVLKHAEENGAKRVAAVNLQAGELRDLTEEWLQRYFDYLSRGTVAEGAKIVLKRIPLTMKCLFCAGTFTGDLRQDKINCPLCNGTETELTGGDEFLIESIEVI